MDSDTNYPTESIGSCTCEHVGAFTGACACFIAICLAYALTLSYQTKDLPVKFSESKYIAISVAYLLQLLILGAPLLFIAQENNSTFYIVASLFLFLSSFGTTLLIFLPKLIAHKKRDSPYKGAVYSGSLLWHIKYYSDYKKMHSSLCIKLSPYFSC